MPDRRWKDDQSLADPIVSECKMFLFWLVRMGQRRDSYGLLILDLPEGGGGSSSNGRWSSMSPFHLDRPPNTSLFFFSHRSTKLCVYSMYYRCNGAPAESRTFLPAALLPSYLTFAFLYFLWLKQTFLPSFFLLLSSGS